MAIDYASWVVNLRDYQQFAVRYHRPHATLKEAFQAKFAVALDDVTLNEGHQMYVGVGRVIGEVAGPISIASPPGRPTHAAQANRSGAVPGPVSSKP